jgi:hypothetical protein
MLFFFFGRKISLTNLHLRKNNVQIQLNSLHAASWKSFKTIISDYEAPSGFLAIKKNTKKYKKVLFSLSFY